MIKTLEIVNSYGEKLPIDLRNPEISGYAITGINGLGPVDVDIKQTQLVSGLKYKYNKGFHKYRDITIQFLFYEWNSNHNSINELRQSLIYYLKTNDFITLYFIKDNGEVRKIQGYVSKHDASYFSNACGAQVIITCPDPWFRKVTRNAIERNRYYFVPSHTGSLIDYVTTRFELVSPYETDYEVANVKNNPTESSGNYTYSLNIDYDGSIVSGFRIEFEDNVSDTDGFKFDIITNHYAMGETGKLYINEPYGYGTTNPSYLEVDTGSDYLSVNVVNKTNQNDKMNVVGWVDSSTISKRKNLPALYNNGNVIQIITNGELMSGSPANTIVAKIYYHTLYRGV